MNSPNKFTNYQLLTRKERRHKMKNGSISEKSAPGEKSALATFLKENRLEDDQNLFPLLWYYLQLREGGDGEITIKLIKGKINIKGAVYMRKIPIID